MAKELGLCRAVFTYLRKHGGFYEGNCSVDGADVLVGLKALDSVGDDRFEIGCREKALIGQKVEKSSD